MQLSARRVDQDGDEFMAPDAAAAAEAVNKFARPASTPSVDADVYSFSGVQGSGGLGLDQRKNFTKQYAALYFTRLTALKPIVLEAARRALGEARFAHCTTNGQPPNVCSRVLDLTPGGAFSVVAGTLYKEMKLKPCILEEYARTSGAAVSTSQEGGKYLSADDSLILEDEHGRVPLVGASPEALPIAAMVSGLVLSLLGREIAGGKFEVHAYFVPEMAPQKPLPAPEAARPPAYMLCVSGLSLGTPGQDPTPVQLLMDYATGLLGSSAEQRQSASIIRVLVAGDSLHRFEKKSSNGGKPGGGAAFSGRDEYESDETVGPLRELDILLTQLASAVPVTILPGEHDPSNFTLPQQPFHKCLFPSASTYSTFQRTTNPSWLRVEGLETLVTAGQNVQDLDKYCDMPATIDYLEHSLRWRCVAPTAPDTLGCYPYQGKDPFVLLESPHLYIVGNQSAFSTRLARGTDGQQVRTVCIPSFAKTGTAVLVDLHSPTLETKSITFKVQGGAAQ